MVPPDGLSPDGLDEPLPVSTDLSLQSTPSLLQPGTFDEDVMAYAKENFGADVEGEGGGGGEG
jgi:hypothetical protein